VPTSNQLKDKIAVVTGASRGIGFAIAEALVEHGCKVVITSRFATHVEEAASKLRPQALPFVCDVREPSAIEALFDFVSSKFGRLDFLINNAGIYGPAKPVGGVSLEGWREALDINLTGTFLCTKHALPLMKAGSVIVNNLSVAAYQVFPNSAAYIASKQGALGLTNATREDLRSRGIRVIALVPGATDTEIWNQFWPEAPREKMMQPEHVASVLLNALLMPAETSVDEIKIMPAGGKL
jgi:3-oxoacyl-[acyl-carrier protein] reductase